MLVLMLDTSFYGKPTLTPLNFLRVNASSISTFYGSSRWHYYFLQALPILCTTSLPFVLHGLFLSFRHGELKLQILAGCAVWTIVVYSLLEHKEWRFLHPVLPMLHILASRSLVELNHRRTMVGHSRRTPKSEGSDRPLARLPIRTRHLVLLLLTVPASIYVVFFHCTGQIRVMSYLRNSPTERSTTIGFLMPCHSTPWQAYLHRADLAHPGQMWALGCEPPLGYVPISKVHLCSISLFRAVNSTRYKDQTDIFFDSPIKYMQSHFPPHVDTSFPPSPFPSSVPDASFVSNITTIEQHGESWDMGWRHEWPKYVVMFGGLLQEPGMVHLFQELGYHEIWKGGWLWEGDEKRKGGVRVWKHDS